METNLAPQIFISHASLDKSLADEILNMIRVGCNFDIRLFFYSSHAETGVSIGEELNFTVREALKDCKLFIAIVTSTFLTSTYCLEELGAAWVLGKKTVVLMCPPVDFKDIPEPAKSRRAINILKSEELDLLQENVAELLSDAQPRTATWTRAKESFLNIIRNSLPIKRNFKQLQEKRLESSGIAMKLDGLATMMARWRVAEKIFAVMIDIDKLNQINNQYGVSAGDRVIYQLSQYLEDLKQDQKEIIDMARCGDDTFFIFCINSDSGIRSLVKRIVQFVASIRRDNQYREIYVTVSAGVTEYFFPERPMICLRRANYFCEEARRRGGNQFIFGNVSKNEAESYGADWS